MRKSFFALAFVGVLFAGSVFTSQNASADPEQQVQLDVLINLVGILFDGINSGFASVATQIGAVQTDVVANTAAISAIGPHTTGVPIGTVFAWTGSVSSKFFPKDFLIADGSSLLISDFPALFNVIGTTYGEGDVRETTFRLPDLRDTFIRGTTVNLGVAGGTASHNHIDDPPNVVISPGGAHTHPVNPPPLFSNFPLEESRRVTLTLPGIPKDVADDNHRHNVNIPTFDSQSTTHSHDVDIGPHPTETAGNEPPFLSLVMIIRAK